MSEYLAYSYSIYDVKLLATISVQFNKDKDEDRNMTCVLDLVFLIPRLISSHGLTERGMGL